MKLKILDSFQDAYKKLIVVVIIIVVAIIIGDIIRTVQWSDKYDNLLSKVIVIDTRGQVYNSSVLAAQEVREVEYANHVRTFVNLFYAFDENTFKKNIEEALYMIGEEGKELYNEYKDLDVEKTLYQKNLRYETRVTDIKIDPYTMPISGKVSFIQTGFRAKGSLEREIIASFTLYEVDRSEKNVHGCKIDKWSIISDRILDNKTE